MLKGNSSISYKMKHTAEDLNIVKLKKAKDEARLVLLDLPTVELPHLHCDPLITPQTLLYEGSRAQNLAYDQLEKRSELLKVGMLNIRKFIGSAIIGKFGKLNNVREIAPTVVKVSELIDSNPKINPNLYRMEEQNENSQGKISEQLKRDLG